ncbi:MAG: serine/threonine protein kinase [Lachnospiraceae bacterium]|nr:serine/threonine protein kinase [Lachnospiraceae bacterium]
MEYEVIKTLKQSEKSTVQLLKESGGERLVIRKTLQGRHQVYQTLQELSHPCMPAVYEVSIDGEKTTVIEEFIEGKTAGSMELSEKQCRDIVRELCGVLAFLHGKGIIHRDIKPSNILLTEDGHIRLIDFDAARMPRKDSEQDTIRLGTRGYAAPEQYGFAQTDERTDIYALGVTIKQLLGDRADKPGYRRILSKCTNLDPDKRYQSARQVERAFYGVSHWQAGVLCAAAVVFAAVIMWNFISEKAAVQDAPILESTDLIVLPAPDAPHWDGETGIGLWGRVFESGVGDDERYDWRLYRCDTETPPDMERNEWSSEGTMRGNVADRTFFDVNFTEEFGENGFYYFAVRASGDGVTYADSPYVLSDVFAYTGKGAPSLPAPEGLYWTSRETDEQRLYFASLSNWDDYEDKDMFNAYVYDEDGEYVMNNILSKETMLDMGWPGVKIRQEFVGELGKTYRFAIQVLSSRPNEYKSTPAVEPCPEEAYLSPPLVVPNYHD